MENNLASLDLTHVQYDADSIVSLGFAFLTLSPILLMASYASLAVFTRELTIINMWAGQLICEALSWVIKRAVKQGRPFGSVGYGYGFPSSHSQWMAYFATFLICHLHFRHQFSSMGNPILDYMVRACAVVGLLVWSGVVAYSRFYLFYHSASQVLWGVSIGVLFAVLFYAVVELIPTRRPDSLLGRARTYILENEISTWLRLRDGWLVWNDCGRETEWKEWRTQMDAQRRRKRR